MKIDHLALYVRDLEGAAAFFARYFEASVGPLYHNPKTDFRSRFLTFSDGARLELMCRPGVPEDALPVPRMGYIHLSFSLGSAAAVDALTARLAADGYAVLDGPRRTGDGYYESCVCGFEQNQIELTV